jgi:hypothetical protein
MDAERGHQVGDVIAHGRLAQAQLFRGLTGRPSFGKTLEWVAGQALRPHATANTMSRAFVPDASFTLWKR